MTKSLVAFAVLSLAAVACAPAATSRPKTAADDGRAMVPSATRSQIDACYAEHKKTRPRLQGAFVAAVKVGAGGVVEGVDAQEVVGLDRDVIGCMTNRLYSARFPDAKGSVVRITLGFEARASQAPGAGADAARSAG